MMRIMPTTPARSVIDPRAPNAPDVEAAYAATDPSMVAEILDGELHALPRPRPRHARAATRLLRGLGPFDDDPGDPGDSGGGWVLLLEPQLHLGPKPDKIVPDVAGWRRERLPATVFDDDAPGHLAIAPDWVCEILSERTERIDRVKKMRIYRREGVGHVWLVNPALCTLEVYRADQAAWTLVETLEGDTRVRAEPFSALELSLATLWAR
jgi:Uma2 family endonuclease